MWSLLLEDCFMNNFKIKFLLIALFLFSLNSTVMATTYDHSIAAVIPFATTPQSTNSTNATGTQTSTTTVPNQTQLPATNQNNMQLNATGGSGLGTSTNGANKAEQDDLYNRSVNNMLNGK